MKSLLRFVQLVGLSAVPFIGVYNAGWSSATAVALYWCESVMAALLIALRVRLHRRATNKRGHYIEVRVTTTTNGSTRTTKKTGYFGGSFLFIALVFSAAQAVFLAFLLHLIGKIDVVALKQGVSYSAAFLVIGFVIDLVGLRNRPFAWVRNMVNGAMGRVMVMHLFVMIGFFVAAMKKLPHQVLGVFIVLKLMNDLATQLPQYNPKEAPRWMVRLLGGGFADYWRKERSNEIATELEDEEPYAGVPSRAKPIATTSRLPS